MLAVHMLVPSVDLLVECVKEPRHQVSYQHRQRNPEGKQRSSEVCNLEQSRLIRPKMKDEVERNFKVPDVVVITESGECYHKSTCSYVKARAKGKAKSRKLRPCTICFPMERKLSGDHESASHHERTRGAKDSLETDAA